METMETYVCLLIDNDRRIVTVEAFTAPDDIAARDKAASAKAASPSACVFELWRKGKKIATAGAFK